MGRGCQSGCERRSDAFLKIIFFVGGGGGGGGGGVRFGVRVESFCGNSKKKKKCFFFWGEGQAGGSDQGLGRGWR